MTFCFKEKNPEKKMEKFIAIRRNISLIHPVSIGFSQIFPSDLGIQIRHNDSAILPGLSTSCKAPSQDCCVPLFEGLEKDFGRQNCCYLTCLECFCVDLIQLFNAIYLETFANWFHLTLWCRCKSSPRHKASGNCVTLLPLALPDHFQTVPFANGWPHNTILLKHCEKSYRTQSV